MISVAGAGTSRVVSWSTPLSRKRPSRTKEKKLNIEPHSAVLVYSKLEPPVQ